LLHPVYNQFPVYIAAGIRVITADLKLVTTTTKHLKSISMISLWEMNSTNFPKSKFWP